MPTGYRVNLNTGTLSDNTLWYGDAVATTPTDFADAIPRIGAGSILAAGRETASGETFPSRPIAGTFYASGNDVFFVPASSGLTIDTATVHISPIYTTNAPITGSNTNLLTETLNGTTSPNTINGLGGPDVLRGGGDAGTITNPNPPGAGGATDTDVLNGGAGNDTLYGQGGWDRLIGGTGNDVLDGGMGLDIADYSAGATGGATIIMSANSFTVSVPGLGTDTLSGIDGIIGTAFGDNITGTNGDGVDADGSTYANYIDGAGGNDTINGLTGSDYLFGGSGDDSIIGGLWDGDPGITLSTGRGSGEGGTIDDRISGGIGNDTIYGDDIAGTDTLGGNDLIDAGDGEDSIVAGFGNDTVYAGAGNDTVIGGLGADTLYGNAGNDTIYGDDTAGADSLGGADNIFAGDGNDSVIAGAGNDTVTGGLGADTLYGNAGDDTIYGDDTAGADSLGGADSIFAGDGNDSVIAGAGNDTVTGGRGADIIYGNAGDDTIYGDDINGTDSLGGADRLFGGDGNDSILGGFGDDSLEGGAGNDILQGGAGRDTLLGGEGADLLEGGDGNDSLVGGAGADRLFGGAGDDVLEGGDGNDTLDGGTGNNMLTGGAGSDVFVVRTGDVITDFTVDSLTGDNDQVDLGSYYNDANLAILNASRAAQGLATYQNALGWLHADQADDGVLNSITTANGFQQAFTLSIRNNNTAVAGDSLTNDSVAVLCFGADALIDTPEGRVPAGDLQVGMLVTTRDAGPQPIRWIGHRHLTEAELEAAPNLRPIRIRAGALGRGTPRADLVVSPQHRVLVRSKLAQRLFGAPEVLVAAKQLLLVDGIDVAEDLAGVDYVHFLFDDHQVVWSNGAETESLHPGRNALNMAGEAGRDEIFAIFPELRDESVSYPAARTMASGRMGRKLAMRHVQNNKPLVS
ncbi:Hint domain-containing protein [Paracoccus sp. MC1862]|uniref:Hint domain-containing protein n=1 Tax=Paracoccus sp. MC1862 TaxID=2760307 RepID=UPI00178D208E|nr:Hint domain-containing protein [Paracoccus sp. MC1862]MBB1499019.1 Hint domain-containing protein [Paracoccus sp. MC1862]QQO44655.1 Hint domain-containing protein [Paracoccus sp. MC1862]